MRTSIGVLAFSSTPISLRNARVSDDEALENTHVDQRKVIDDVRLPRGYRVSAIDFAGGLPS